MKVCSAFAVCGRYRFRFASDISTCLTVPLWRNATKSLNDSLACRRASLQVLLRAPPSPSGAVRLMGFPSKRRLPSPRTPPTQSLPTGRTSTRASVLLRRAAS